MADYEQLRQRHLADLAVLMPEHVQRLRWPAERLRQERRDRLRDLLARAKSSSPWHRDRLAGVDPGGFEEADLAGLPPMTKDDLMANWDGVVTDPRLTLDLVEGHLAGLGRRLPVRPLPRRRLRRLHRAPGDLRLRLAGMGGGYAGFLRTSVWDRAVTPELAAVPMRIAMVGARNATHMTSAMPQTFANPSVDIALFPVTQPIDQIVAGLNAYQPLALMGYPSMLALLAETRAGRLRILPKRITTTSEPLLPEVRRALTESFRAPWPTCTGPPRPARWGRLLARPRHPPLRRPGHHRAGRPGRPPGPARRPLRQALRDRHLQPDPAADPSGAHRPGDVPGHAVCLRLRPPADRRRGEPPGRPLQLPGRPGGAPARLRRTAPPRPGDHRVPGPPDPGRRRGPGRRDLADPPPPAAWSPPSWPAWASARPSRSASSTGWSGRRPERSGGSARWRRSAGRRGGAATSRARPRTGPRGGWGGRSGSARGPRREQQELDLDLALLEGDEQALGLLDRAAPVLLGWISSIGVRIRSA